MKKNIKRLLVALIAVTAALWLTPAFAEALPWQLGMQDPVSPSAERLHNFHNMLLWIIAGICFLVLALLVAVILRFNAKTNPQPAQFAHNTLIEVIWTVIPVLILIVIMVPSFQVLYANDRLEEYDMTLKITGYQWYWGYEYPDHNGISFMSYMIPEDEIDEAAGQKRLLSTDNAVVLPVDTNIQLLITAADVLHSWAMPALGIKMDAVPGRINETWVRIEKPGIYYGQCSELCGKDHAFMPIEIHAISKEEFEAWVSQASEEFSALEPDNINLKLASKEGY